MGSAVALLRAVNVAGSGTLAMADLRASATRAGAERVATVLQTGNLVFALSSAGGAAAWQSRLADALATDNGLRTEIIVRTRAAWADLIAQNPFADVAEDAPARLAVFALKDAAAGEKADTLAASITGPERIALRGNTLYAHYPDGMGRSKLTGQRIERALGTPATARNWNTVLKIMAALDAAAEG